MPDKFFRSVLPGELRELPKIDTSVAHIARVYDYWLGGKDNISQVLSYAPHSTRTDVIQARQVNYSKTKLTAVRDVFGTYMGVMSKFLGDCS